MKINKDYSEVMRIGRWMQEQNEDVEPFWYKVGLFLLIILVTVTFFAVNVQASDVVVDLNKIKMIESSNCRDLYGRYEHARGCYQITQIVVDEWNNFHKGESYVLDDMLDEAKAKGVADWYLHVRIPQMIRYFNKEVTIRNIIISWNAGISYVAYDKPIPRITKLFLTKYKKL